jgi:hypothetical protein
VTVNNTSKTADTELCNRLHRNGPDSCNQLHTLDVRIAYYIGAARAPATHRAYAADIAAFLACGGAIPRRRRPSRPISLAPTTSLSRHSAGDWRRLPTPIRPAGIRIRPSILLSVKSFGGFGGYEEQTYLPPTHSTSRCCPRSSERYRTIWSINGIELCSLSVSSAPCGGRS